MRQCAELNSYDCLRNNEDEKNGIIIPTLYFPKSVLFNYFGYNVSEIFKATSVSINHVTYNVKDYLVLSVQDDGIPIFLCISYLLKHSER